MTLQRIVLVGAGVLAIGTAAAAVGVARAQPARSFPDPQDVRLSASNDTAGWTPSGAGCVGCTTAVTKEPATGFVGACLLDSMTFAPALPLVCYAPKNAVTYVGVQPGNGVTTVSFPAAEVFHPYSTLPASFDSYQVLVTCFPHKQDGSCPQPSSAISRSCCDYGANMTSLDGQTAQGFVLFQ